MGILHTVNKSPFEKSSLQSCLRYAKPGSALLLMEDGVYAALWGGAFEEPLKRAAADLSLYCLEPDLKARGFPPERLIDGVRLVDYGGFVDLAVEYDKVQAWL